MKIKLTLIISGILVSTLLYAQSPEVNFPYQKINFSAPPRTSITNMSLKLWDNYNDGGPTQFGTVLEFYGQYAHQTGQLYFGGWDNSKIRYREAFYAQNTWSDWMTLLDSKNNVESAGSLMISGQGNHYIKAGNVGIGTITPKEKLSVNGNIRAHEVKVETTGWPDYVFQTDYQLPTIIELEKYIKTNKHLPGMPTAKEVESDGAALGETVKQLLKNQEQLTLYIIEQQKQIEALKQKLNPKNNQ